MTSATDRFVTIEEESNPYRQCIQGLANEPICVKALLDRSFGLAGPSFPALDSGSFGLDEIVERLVQNRPRIAVIGGSMDHPAHLRDDMHLALAALGIWQRGGVPFSFNIPVICDGTAQNQTGMSYSLASRNHTASALNITFEGHAYHAAYVLSSCDKFPAAVISGLAAADLARTQPERGQAPVWAVFAPSHVLRGGEIAQPVRKELMQIAKAAEQAGHPELAEDMKDNLRYILQCTSDEAYAWILQRAMRLDIISPQKARGLLNRLAAATCHEHGGICAFNGTGNSSRTLTCALGLVPRQAELLMDAPGPDVVDGCVDALFNCLNRPQYRISNLLGRNFANAVRVHNTTGSSSNLILHLPALMRYAGFDVSLDDYVRIRQKTPAPEIFAHSLTDGRDTFALARQFAKGQHRGMESIYQVLNQLGVPMDLDAPTVMGQTWRERLAGMSVPVDPALGDKAVIRTTPVRQTSGVEVLRGNIMNSAVIKLAGMSDEQIGRFAGRLFLVRYYANEHLCINDMASPDLAHTLESTIRQLPEGLLDKVMRHNCPGRACRLEPGGLLDMVKQGAIAFAFVIAGQGPKAFGMPEMFTPSQVLRHHSILEASSLLITDGRYSGVTKGACIGHVTPEAYEDGGIGWLRDGDVLWLRIAEKRLDWVDSENLLQGELEVRSGFSRTERAGMQLERQKAMDHRLLQVAASNLMTYATDAEKGCVPLEVDQRATRPPALGGNGPGYLRPPPPGRPQ